MLDPQKLPSDLPMIQIGELLGPALGELLRRQPPDSAPPSLPPCPPSEASVCRCQHSGMLVTDPSTAATARLIIVEHYGTRVLVLCPVCAAGRAQAAAWSGLSADALQIQFTALRAVPAQRAAIAALIELIRKPRGWVTLAGSYGTGKTTLLYGTLNYLSSFGVYGRYTTAPDLIDHLRDAVRDADGRAHSERLERLKTAPVLAVDELDKYRTTDYAEEALFKLFDYRYRERGTLATLIGYNRERGDRIPPFLTSRIRDGRFRLVELDGPDLRPFTADD